MAILSDIHGNLEALQAILADAIDHGAERPICLGDTVGYGPNPIECLWFSMAWPVVLLGNFDVAAISEDDLSGWTALAAARSIFWFRSLLRHTHDAARFDRFLRERPRLHQQGNIVFVHATPRNPLYEYLGPQDVENQEMMGRIGETFAQYCFSGHTHIPGLFVEDGPRRWRFLSPEECTPGYRLNGRKMICNVGSVGQPRDDDWRASYVLFDGETIRFRRVEYDVDATVKKIYANPELDNFLGDRLREGR